MTPHENVEAFWAGERPERIPFAIGGGLCSHRAEDADMLAYFERGLVPTYVAPTFAGSAKGVERTTDTYEEDGQAKLKPCAEVCLGERAAEAILGRGLMPLQSYRDRNAVRVTRFQSIADPPTALAGRWG